MQEKSHRSISLLLLICLPLCTLPTFLKIKKRLEKNVKNVKKRDQNKKQRKTFLHLCKQGRNWCSWRRGPTEAMNSIMM